MGAPAIIIYHPVFVAAGAIVVKMRKWLEMAGMDPDSRLGRGIIMALSSFVTIVGLQVLISAMARVYAGELGEGYLTPLKDDWASRHMDTWIECHMRKGFTLTGD